MTPLVAGIVCVGSLFVAIIMYLVSDCFAAMKSRRHQCNRLRSKFEALKPGEVRRLPSPDWEPNDRDHDDGLESRV
jgi:hypothetical protein